MLTQNSRLEIVRRLSLQVGYQFNEEDLSPATRQAITNLATLQRHLFVITEMLRGENSRIERSFILSAAAKLGRGSEKKERAKLAAEVKGMQDEIDRKVTEISAQIQAEARARSSGQEAPAYAGKPDLVQLKCPSCGAPLPIPTGRFTRCQFCDATFTIQDVSQQIRSMIQSV